MDNGTDPIGDLLPTDSRLKYFQILQPRMTHGALMNECFQRASGEIVIVHDDDDWYAPDRISRQVAPFSDPEVLVTGMSRLYYYVHGTENAYRYQNWTSMPWIGAFALRRSVWENQPFENIPAGADCKMLKSIPEKNWKALTDLDLMVATIHPENASMKRLPSMSFIETPWDEICGVTKGSLIESV
jgi:glycosyltransferase involved in cell wall biosynthesis